MSSKFVGYYRVSSGPQGRAGLGLEAQQAVVRTYLDGEAGQLVGEFTEIESGHKNERPELAKALALCKKYKATLLIARLDRLARSVHFITGLMETKVKFIACDMPGATPFMLHIYAAAAQEEARAISVRTKAALLAAKARGVRLPRRSVWAYRFAQSPSRISLPRKGCRVGLRIVLFQACSAFTRVAACTLALPPIRDTLFSYFVTSIAAPVASGWSVCRVGLAPTGKRRLITARTR
jgi:DNA invertase Pin-like site-specific DNA recombinase